MKPLQKGFSKDQKFYKLTPTGPQLVRIAKIDQTKRKEEEFEWMKQVFALGVPIPEPLSFKVEGEVTSTFSWCEGNDLRDQLPYLDQSVQYDLGVEAGRYLRMIHSLQAPETTEPFDKRYAAKIDRKIEQYNACPLYFSGDEKVLSFIKENRSLINGRPQTFHHGDYHTANMVLSKEGKLSIIDFDRFDFGDPWEEFNRIAFSAEESPAFATGQIRGYFDGEPPEEFFTLLALYMTVNSLSGLPWALLFGEAEIAFMRQQAEQIIHWYDGIRTVIPSWYLPLR